MPPKILVSYYKTGHSTDHRSEFHAGWPTHHGNVARGKK